MADIAAVGGSGTGRLEPVIEAAHGGQGGRGAEPSTPGRMERPSDRVELSDRARLLSKLSKLPAVRQDLIDQVRRQIEAGEYDTPGRLDAAIDHLVEDLDAME